jgi:hypothetical protein
MKTTQCYIIHTLPILFEYVLLFCMHISILIGNFHAKESSCFVTKVKNTNMTKLVVINKCASVDGWWWIHFCCPRDASTKDTMRHW